MGRVLRVVLVLTALSIPAFSQTSRPFVAAPHKPFAPRVNRPMNQAEAISHTGSTVGALWMTDANLKSSIYLTNIVENSAVTITPILYLSNGNKYVLPNVELEPAGTAVIDVNSALAGQGISSYATLSGYVELQYAWPWNPICATVRIVDPIHSLIFTYGFHSPATNGNSVQTSSSAQTANTASQTPSVVEGVWWKQEKDVTGFVALSNITTAPLEATVQTTDDQTNVLATHIVTISPHGTKIVSLSELQWTTTPHGGVRVSYNAPQNALVINGGLEDQAVGYSAILPFSAFASAPTTVSDTSVAELGLMIGSADPMMSFPAGTTFTPYSILRNISDTAFSITPTIWWMQGGTVHSAQLSQLTMSPYQTESLDVAALLATEGLRNYNGMFNLVFDVHGKQGGLLLAAGSVDQRNTYVFEVTPHGIVESAAKSLSYWSTGNGDDTMLTLWNPADESQDFIFKLVFSGGHYLFPVHLEPRATLTLNVSQIIQNQIPDTEGNTIPADIHEGSAKISGIHADNEEILVAVDAGTYNVRKATCGMVCWNCDGWVSSTLSPGSFNIAIGNSVQFTFKDQWADGSTHDITDVVSWSSNQNLTANGPGQFIGASSGIGSVAASDGLEPVYTPNVCVPGSIGDPCPVGRGIGIGTTGNVGDATPIISNISPNVWPAGSTNLQVTITGSGFGTNTPSLSITGTGISYSISSSGDKQIVASVTITANAPDQSPTVTVTSNGYNGSGFVSVGGSQPTSGSTNVTVTAIAAPAPRIFFNGTDVTGTTQSVVVGQQIALGATPTTLQGNLIVSSASWTIPGTVVGGYNASTNSSSLVAPNFAGTATTIYWVYAGQNLQVQYSYCMNNGRCSSQATSNFNVAGVTGVMLSTLPTNGLLHIDMFTGCPAAPPSASLVFGNLSGAVPECQVGPYSGPAGVAFQAITQQPGNGNFSFAQIVNEGLTVYTIPSGNQRCPLTPGDDNNFPYAGQNSPTQAADAPFADLAPGTTAVTRSFDATMYLLWRSSLPNSIYVPVGFQEWQFTGSDTLTSGQWPDPASGSGGLEGSYTPSTPAQPFDGYPVWSNVLVNPCN